jgi:hypothetical protein
MVHLQTYLTWCIAKNPNVFFLSKEPECVIMILFNLIISFLEVLLVFMVTVATKYLDQHILSIRPEMP